MMKMQCMMHCSLNLTKPTQVKSMGVVLQCRSFLLAAFFFVMRDTCGCAFGTI